MKTSRILQSVGLSVALAGMQAQAASINTGQNPSSPFYADFHSTSVNMFYDWQGTGTGSSANGSGVLSVFNPYTAGNVVTKDVTYDMPGGGHALQSGLGSYVIDATISVVNGVASLSGGTVEVYGNVLPGGGTGDLLLRGSLRTGLGGVAFGYEDYASAGTPTAGKYDLFQFIFDVTGGNPAIVADYMGIGGTGAIILDANFDYTGTTYNGNNGSKATTAMTASGPIPAGSYQGFNGDWARDFSNPLGNGYANTFVPEPAAYPVLGALLASVCVVRGRRKSRGMQAGSN